MILDFHTHNPSASGAIINAEPTDILSPTLIYSVGIHPWHAGEATSESLKALDDMAAMDNVVAIGETGIDRLRSDADIDTQISLLRHHIDLSERLKKPLVLHVVRGYDIVMQLHKQLNPSQPWVIHGFRGKPELTRQLIREGLYLSIGEHFNPQSLALIPPSRLLLETDESPLSIQQIAERAGVNMVDAAKQLALTIPKNIEDT